MNALAKYFAAIALFPAVMFVHADLPSRDVLLDRALDKYPTGSTDLVQPVDRWLPGTSKTRFDPSNVVWPEVSLIKKQETIILPSDDYPAMLKWIERIEEENRKLRREIDLLRSMLEEIETRDAEAAMPSTDGRANRDSQ